MTSQCRHADDTPTAPNLETTGAETLLLIVADTERPLTS
jgi:hypothetical protein